MAPSPSSLVLYLKEIYLFDAILPSFGIHQVEYLSRDQKGRERGWERTERRCYDIFKKCKMERCRKLRVEKKTLNREHGYCYLEGGAGVSTGVSYLSNKPVYLRCVCVYITCPLINVCECRRQWIPQILPVQIHTSAESHCESNCTSQANTSQMWLCWICWPLWWH